MNKIETTRARLNGFTSETDDPCMPVSAGACETSLADGAPVQVMEAPEEIPLHSH